MARHADLARYYDLDLQTDPGDLPFYLGLGAKSGGLILELAVGSGRVAVPLAAAGHDVTGVDNDAAMLNRARARRAGSDPSGRGGSLTLIEHDLITLDLPARFDLVFIALNSLLLLDGRAAQQAALETMHRHLAPGGRVAVDVWLPQTDDLALYDGREVLEWVRTDPETGERVAKTTSATYDPATNTAVLTTAFDGDRRTTRHDPRTTGHDRRTTRHDKITFIGTDDLLAAAAQAGLAAETVAGNYDMSAWSATSERVVLIARGTSG